MEEKVLPDLCKSPYNLGLDTALNKKYVAESKKRQGHTPPKQDVDPAAHEDLIREIAVLELDIMCLEKYLLSMYRKTFGKRLESLSIKDDKANSKQNSMSKENSVTSTSPILPMKESDDPDTKLVDSTILRCHSSLSHAACSFRASSPSVAALAEALDSYHSLPLTMLEHAQASTSNRCLMEHPVANCSNHYHGSPSWLSEEMIKCISALYCQLADPPFPGNDLCSSPISVSSSTLESFPQAQTDIQRHQRRENSSSDSSFDDPFHIEESKGFNGCFGRMVEVQGLCRDSRALKNAEHILKQFRYLVSKLEEIDPREMRHEEKLAFWINVHNALVMHAFLVHGIPKNNLKRASLLLKAAYNIGGNTVSVDMIQNSILRCHLPRPGQWLQSLLFTKQRFKTGDARRGYAIEHPDPRLRFALCSGYHSDPVLRLYTSKRMFEDLEVAKEEYIQANIRVNKGQKLVLPKNVESYIKEVNLCPSGLFETVEQALPSYLRKKLQQPDEQRKLWKKIDWIPHNFSFRYLISNELLE